MYLDEDLAQDIVQITLERMHFGCQEAIDEKRFKRLVEHAQVTAYLDMMLRDMVIQLDTYIFGQELRTFDFKWPAGWWQAFKERWFPGWARRRWPVVYHHEKVKLHELWPELRTPEHESHVQIPFVKDESWTNEEEHPDAPD